MAEPVTLERDGALAIITLDRPPLNLFDAAMFAALRAAVDAVAADPPRGLLVRAEGARGQRRGRRALLRRPLGRRRRPPLGASCSTLVHTRRGAAAARPCSPPTRCA